MGITGSFNKSKLLGLVILGMICSSHKFREAEASLFCRFGFDEVDI